MTLSDWLGIGTLLLLFISFYQRQKLVNKEDLELLRSDLANLRESAGETLAEARKTNGRLTSLEEWRKYHETWKAEQLDEIRARIDNFADVPKPKPPRRRK